MPKQRIISPIEVAAEKTVSRSARQHAEYSRVSFTERDLKGGEMAGSRMEKDAPVRGLERMLSPRVKRSKPLPVYIRQTAFIYFHDLMEMQGSMNHEIREFHDSSPNTDYQMCYRLDCINRISRMHSRMRPEQRKALDMVMIQHPDSRLTKIWPERSQRQAQKGHILDGLYWLAAEYEFCSRPVDNL